LEDEQSKENNRGRRIVKGKKAWKWRGANRAIKTKRKNMWLRLENFPHLQKREED